MQTVHPSTALISDNEWMFLRQIFSHFFQQKMSHPMQGLNPQKDSRFIAVEYNMTLKMLRKEKSSNLIQTMNSRKTPHTSPIWLNYEASFMASLGKSYQDISRVHCSWNQSDICCWVWQSCMLRKGSFQQDRIGGSLRSCGLLKSTVKSLI